MAAGVRYKDLPPRYDHVESFIGVSGRREGLAQLPDGNFLPPMPMNCVETKVAAGIKKHFGSVARTMIESRTANLTRAHNGRGQCMYRNRCRRGCP